MKVLVVKLTSMGDVLHVLPALTDFCKAKPGVQIDWLVEESFKEIPAWHPAVNQVVTVATRRWRKLNITTLKEILSFKKKLRQQEYDVVIDAQGLMKSAGLAWLAKAKRRVGFCGKSMKESPAAWFYNDCVSVPRELHAIERLRQLFSTAFNYDYSEGSLDYGIGSKPALIEKKKQQTVVFLHGTTWATKHLPEAQWLELREIVIQAGFKVQLAWGNQTEKNRAEGISKGQNAVEVLDKSSITQLKEIIAQAAGVIAVDTGLGHLTAALGVPCVSLYGSTDARLTGTAGANQQQLQADYKCSPCLRKYCRHVQDGDANFPCYQSMSMPRVWQALESLIV